MLSSYTLLSTFNSATSNIDNTFKERLTALTPYSDDLNTTTYSSIRPYNANTPNAPTTNGGIVITMFNQRDTQGCQIAKANNQNFISLRYTTGAQTWGIWHKIALFDMNSPIVPTGGTNITIENGGYFLVGNLVIVNIRLKAEANIPAFDIIVKDLPYERRSPNDTNTVPVLTDPPIAAYLEYGKIKSSSALSSGERLIIHCAYMINSLPQ